MDHNIQQLIVWVNVIDKKSRPLNAFQQNFNFCQTLRKIFSIEVELNRF